MIVLSPEVTVRVVTTLCQRCQKIPAFVFLGPQRDLGFGAFGREVGVAMTDVASVKGVMVEAEASTEGYLFAVWVASPEARVGCGPEYPTASNKHQMAKAMSFLIVLTLPCFT